MPRVKVPRKSTNVDMTAMCDVAFLLLTFFMLATKFKPDEAVKVTTPSSVSADALPDKNAFQVLFDKTGRVFFTYTDPEQAASLIDYMNTQQSLGLNDAEKKNFLRLCGIGIGVPFNELKGLLDVDPDQVSHVNQPGIPCSDSLHNQLRTWVAGLLASNGGKKPDNVLIKGDNTALYPQFKEVLNAFTDNKVFQFKLVTAMSDAPPGTALYEERHPKK